MRSIQAAIYARVSSDQQVEAHTIESQFCALRTCVAAAGLVVPEERQFRDEGYSGATLVRPALERLRDLVAVGGIDQLYVHSPDRLARKYAYQVLLIEEFQRAGVEVIFLNRPLQQTPEDELLLQAQGMVAEYERAKILERSRRGKRHAAHAGQVSVLSAAPYGYRYLPKQEGKGAAHFEIVPEEARVVKQLFAWVGRERLSIGEVTRRLNQAGERTRTGKTTWDRGTVWGMLKNPAYMGEAAFGKTRSAAWQPGLRPQRGHPPQPRRPVTTTRVAPEEWIAISVPALVERELFEAVKEQLEENQRHARQRQRGARYLLQGLVICRACGYAYYGKSVSLCAAKGKRREYAYYRCLGTDAYRFGGERVCQNRQVRTDLLDAGVWEEVCRLLERPRRLEQEYRRRWETGTTAPSEKELAKLEAGVGKLRQGLGRLIDSYAEGLIEKEELEPRLRRQRERIAQLEEERRQREEQTAQQAELQVILGRLEAFAGQVEEGLASADWSTRRELIRTLVKRVEIDAEQVEVVFRVDPDPFERRPERGVWQQCRRGSHAALRGSAVGGGVVPVLKVSGLEQALDQPQEAVVVELFPQDRHQDLMVQVVEAAGDVPLDEPDRAAPARADFPEGGVTPPSRSEAMGVVAELRFATRLQEEAYHLLQQLVSPSWDAERTLLLGAFLLDVDAPHCGPPIPFLANGVNDPLDLFQGHPVCGFLRAARCHRTLVPVNLAVGHQIEVRVEQLSVEVLQRQSSSTAFLDDSQDRFSVTHLADFDFLGYRDSLPPFAVWTAFPSPDYYGGSVALEIAFVRRSRIP